MRPNVFVVLAAFLYFIASAQYAIQGLWKLSIIFLAYAVANVMLSLVKE